MLVYILAIHSHTKILVLAQVLVQEQLVKVLEQVKVLQG
jgi:hypothetical protein